MVKPIQHILIANRGEIAHRIIRTAQRMGIRTTAIYSDPDADLPYVRAAQQAIRLPGTAAAETYLDQDLLLGIARKQGADAIHPGYGFLSEQAAFAKKCAEAGLRFIGPNATAIASMGSKSEAKAIMEKHEVPTIPGYRGADQTPRRFQQEAEHMGFPVLVKAAAGGGGKGMRIVRTPEELPKTIQSARREAKAAFGDDELLLERYFESARHIEFQIFGDQHGNVIHLLERECTIQRRYQKVLEESPSPVLSADDRKAMGAAAVRAAKALNYDNAGTVEFIYTGPGSFFFLEVNTRLQVEHPVTEAITGLDLVQWQIEVAEGRRLQLRQADIKSQGYALQCRLYAEDPHQDFLPDSGAIHYWHTPEIAGLRYDSSVESGSEVSIHYDPMIAKIIAHGPDRATAHRRMRSALNQLSCLGPKTNQQLLAAILEDPDFQNGKYDTHYLKNNKESLLTAQAPGDDILAIALVCAGRWHQRQQKKTLLAHIPSGWRNNRSQGQLESYRIGEQDFSVSYRRDGHHLHIDIGEYRTTLRILSFADHRLRVEQDGRQNQYPLFIRDDQAWVQLSSGRVLRIDVTPRFPDVSEVAADNGYTAPMPGQVIQVLVADGQEVTAGTPLLILTSMKMENTIEAHSAGKVDVVHVETGEQVAAGTTLITMTKNETIHAV
jgi:acetyl/propionyl-CoA carboxylase alpha subunit